MTDHAIDPEIMAYNLQGHNETKFKNGTTWNIRGDVSGHGKGYSFFASRSLYEGNRFSRITVTLRAPSGKSIRESDCGAYRDAVRANPEVVDYFQRQWDGRPHPNPKAA